MEYYQKSPYRSGGRHKNQKKISGGMPELLLFYILPFIVFNSILFYCVTSTPDITLEVHDTNDYLSSEATMTVESWIPVKSMAVNMDGEELELTKGKRRSYTVPVTRNGVLEATVVGINGMSTTVFRHVNILDDNPPSFENATLEDGILTLRVSDSQSLVNPDSIYAVDSAGQQLSPLSTERMENTADNTIDYELKFEMDLNGLHVYIQDKAGNEAQKTFSTHKEGNLDVLEADNGAESVPDASGEQPLGEETNEAASESSSGDGTDASSPGEDVSIVIE